MLIKPEIDSKYTSTEIHVCDREMNDSMRRIIKELHSIYDSTLYGTDGKGNRCALPVAGMIAFYSEGQKVFAMNDDGAYSIAKKLYELEEELDRNAFVRISKSEIINYRKIKKLDMSIVGTIRVIMKNGYETYASRRNVAKLKELLVKET